MQKNYNSEKRQLNSHIPTELWGIIFAKNDMKRIDELITQLLCDYYGVELHGRNRTK